MKRVRSPSPECVLLGRGAATLRCAQLNEVACPVCGGRAGGAYFTAGGGCTTNSDGTCFYSPNYPSNYGGWASCSITVAAHEAVTLSVVSFDVEAWVHSDYGASDESNDDYLRVNGIQYYGTAGPDGVEVAAGDAIYFTSGRDYLEYLDAPHGNSGFAICGASPAPNKRSRRCEHAHLGRRR